VAANANRVAAAANPATKTPSQVIGFRNICSGQLNNHTTARWLIEHAIFNSVKR
jgi:hypothetical protein